MSSGKRKVGRKSIELPNAEKVLFRRDGIARRDLVGYYRGVAGQMLPLLRDRPVSVIRFPDGIAEPGIVQKNVPAHFPDWITRAQIAAEGGPLEQVICDKPATLMYLAGQGASSCTASCPGWTGSTSPTSSSSTWTHRTTTGSMMCGCPRCGWVSCFPANWACPRS